MWGRAGRSRMQERLKNQDNLWKRGFLEHEILNTKGGNVSRAIFLSNSVLEVREDSASSVPRLFRTIRPLNNTFIYGSNGYCSSSWSTAGCTTFRGGQYNQFSSMTRGTASPVSYPTDASPYPALNFITDNFTLSSNVTLGDFPIGIVQADWGEQGYFPQMAMGLGANSTVLNALKASGQIASRSWGMFWGRTGATPNTQLDGNMVLGGYDRAKVTGANHTQSLSNSKASCYTNMLVTITNMIVNFPNGTDASIFGGAQSTAITACIVPDYPVLMTLPTDPYMDTFEMLTNSNLPGRSFGLYYYGMLYGSGPDSTPFQGDLTFELDSGLTIRIPNDQLVVPNLSIDQQSGALIANSSTPELVINGIQQVNADDLPQLGRQFLSSAYVMVNQDSNQFTLWAANPTSKQDIVAVDTANSVVDEFCTADSVSGPSPVSGNSTASSAPQSTSTTDVASTSSKPSSAAIGGIAVGVIAVVAAIAGVIIWFMIRKKRSKGSPSELAASDGLMQGQDGMLSPAGNGVSQGVDVKPPMELDSSTDAGVDWDKSKEELYEFSRLETTEFYPTETYITKWLESDPVTSFMRRTRYRKPVYIITSIKVVTRAKVKSKNINSHGGQLGFEVDGTLLGGAPVNIEPNVEGKREDKEDMSWKESSDFVFAFRVRRIRVEKKTKETRHEDYRTGVALDTDAAQKEGQDVPFEPFALKMVNEVDMKEIGDKFDDVEVTDGDGIVVCAVPK
ncbi:hypothetical protein G7Y89_g9875 [Cudoniella acicularis]|uniref:Peptidase A1 domain-containing protein n=1 Tax=Cudoniella acicularis TaxID=354080 RepID=A0A8H4RFD9_9HELO|nr:hypothetical protein G7Y89_g9875 [Cudoniella acicularis]